MSTARTSAVALHGVSASLVEVEADLGNGIPGFVLLGLPDASLSEARERIKAAARNSGIPLANRKLTVNLSPATLPKYGSAFDLAIVIAALAADQQLFASASTLYMAELGLDGTLRPVPGVLPAVQLARAHGLDQVIVAEENGAEARLVGGVEVIALRHLGQVMAFCGAAKDQITTYLRHRPPQSANQTGGHAVGAAADEVDLGLVNGQQEARLALELAAAGGHHLIMVGPAGAGKTMLAKCLPTIMPPLDDLQALEATAVHSITRGGAGELDQLQRTPPFVAPHHTASRSALIGGGTAQLIPGAITRAHHGILFLDEAAQFHTGVLDALRQPIEEGYINLARIRGHQRLPARFQLIMASNPCPCGKNFGTGTGCTCTPMARRRYFARLSGPILDRVDLRVRVNPVPQAQLLNSAPNESSAQVRERVVATRARSQARLGKFSIACNAQIPTQILKNELDYPARTRAALEQLATRRGLSARAIHRLLRVAWTVADQQEHTAPTADDLAIAGHLRQNLESS
ncbi:YifB family Mg chelatase-like AAA ATPase [Glutamicibacter nicotianae]|uniref:YifB family Mg chelatase-like AAA ATPase n=1 Tax=Glutamicibacter nicotianae TaxID=37929 RepID=UPI000EF8B13E|nr:YifB family Mg chelatase-like AAA ATPase [Glutamicibacter nicotianae]